MLMYSFVLINIKNDGAYNIMYVLFQGPIIIYVMNSSIHVI